MATRTPTTTFLTNDRDVIKFVWSGLLNGDTGGSIELSNYADRSVQVSGTFGSGGSVLVEGSNNQSTYSTLNKMTDGTAMVATTAQVIGVLEVTERTRPRVTAGDGATNLTVVMIARKTS